jgi:tRNA(Ile)-lysidine synthase
MMGALTLRRWRGRLTVEAPQPEVVAAQALRLDVSQPGIYRVPGWDGALHVRDVVRGGVAASRLVECELRPRLGAEQFQPAPNRPARGLKKQFQAAAIAPWQRHAPLLWCDNLLVFVPGLGIDARAWAGDGEAQRAFDWLPA